MSNRKKFSLLVFITALFGFFSDSNAFASLGWQKVCHGTAAERICNVVEDVVTDYGQPLAIFNVITKGDMKKLQITVPTGRHLPEGLSFRIGNGTVRKLDYKYCLGLNCVADGDIDDNIIQEMKNGQTLNITTVNFQGESNPLEVSLTGFGKAYDSKGITEKEFAERRAKLAQNAAQREELTAKKLIEAQQKVK